MSGPAIALSTGLNDSRVAGTLARLHQGSRLDKYVMLRAVPAGLFALLQGKPWFDTVKPQLKNAHLKIGYEAGELIYNTARAIDARRIVEFGSSFGFSTICLAAAVRDNGGGIVISTELEANKVDAARANVAAAGLAEFVEIRHGDAQQTLVDVDAPIDLVLLDGWKDLYIPIVELLAPKFRRGSVVFADNINIFKKTLRPYVDHMRDPANGFVSTTTPVGSGMEYSVYLPSNGQLNA